MVIAKIAEENLDEKTKKKVHELIDVLAPFYPKTSTFVTAATWADHASNSGFAPWRWHGKYLPYDNGFLSKTKKKLIIARIEADSGITELKQAVKTLKSENATKLEKAIMLRFLIHIVGDLHQPLHCISVYSKKFPSGDRGGCRVLLDNKKYYSLHALWDSALERDYIWLKKPLDKKGEKYLEDFKNEVLSMFPEKSLKGVNNLNFNDWANESYNMAILHAYKNVLPSSYPDQKYILSNRKIAYERIALAGFRLSKLLNEIFKDL